MKEYRNTILCGDIREIAKTLPSGSINCIVTSPPYYGLRDYGLPLTHWPVVTYAPMDGLPSVTIPAMLCCLGLEDSIEAYVGHMILVFRELWRVLRDDGVAWLNLGDSYANTPKGSIVIDNSTLSGSKSYQANGTPPGLLNKSKATGLKPKTLIGIPWRVAFALQADGWYLRSEVIWAKPNPMPESVTDRPTKAHEQIFLLTKRPCYWYDAEAIREPANYDGRNDTRMKGADKLKDVPGQSPNSMFTNGAERWPNTMPDGSPGRNARTVWPIVSAPFKGAHFAVMPPVLVEKCLLAGCPSRVCVECGEPWVRVVEKETEFHGGSGKAGRTAEQVNASGKWAGKQYGKNIKLGPVIKTKTIARRPTCQCSAPHRHGIVLDPFFGSGTVGVVAIETARDWLGIELNSSYVEMAQERLDQTQPALFPRE